MPAPAGSTIPAFGRVWLSRPVLGRNMAMIRKPNIAIERADPRLPALRALIAELDRLMAGLYPAESNYLVDVDALVGPETVLDRKSVV